MAAMTQHIESQQVDDGALLIPLGRLPAGRYKGGVPFPRGLLKNLLQIEVRVDDETITNYFLSELNRWDDHSYRWLLLGLDLSAPANVSVTLHRQPVSVNDVGDVSQKPSAEVARTPESINVQRGAEEQLTVAVDSPAFSMFQQNSSLFKGSFQLIFDDGSACTGVTDVTEFNLLTNPKLPRAHTVAVTATGRFKHPAQSQEVLFEAKWTTALTGARQLAEPVELQITLHNPLAAKHPNGLWDLGDDNSLLFREFSLLLETASGSTISFQLDDTSPWEHPSNTAVKIQQHASGGLNWQSPVHVDRDNNVPFERNGFTLEQEGKTLREGDRASPVIRIQSKEQSFSLYGADFWQAFPSAVTYDHEVLKYGFFPSTGYLHELQAGEKKTFVLFLGVDQSVDLRKVATKPFALPVEWLMKTGVVPFFSGADHPGDSLVALGLEGNASFAAKRELLDEYGWRNFGDLYADHEAAEYKGDDVFVSHYNNQYDPLYGFIKQYLSTSDDRWFGLAQDLATHVCDIDIYHTSDDKHEYNGGLFWHTDHYVQACTATHRSFSKRQESGVYEDHAGGGGPGGQHCYTTGLMLHYCLTGEDSSKAAVLGLTHWVENYYDGRNTLFEWLLALKNRHVTGLKNHFDEQYPLDRGTGHLLIAYIDSYEVCAEKDYLEKAIRVIRHTVDPSEDINKRGLDDVERCWFYTVFLQGVYRYLTLKEQLAQLDEDFYYARDCLLNFAQWMADHEYPYLEKPELLEFPNDTWTAQDLRKACIFAAAHYYSHQKEPVFQKKAEFFRDYVVEKLTTSDEVHYTRVQVLLLQNKGVTEFFLNRHSACTFEPVGRYSFNASYKNRSFIEGAIRTFFKRLCRFSITEESRWLRSRMN